MQSDGTGHCEAIPDWSDADHRTAYQNGLSVSYTMNGFYGRKVRRNIWRFETGLSCAAVEISVHAVPLKEPTP